MDLNTLSEEMKGKSLDELLDMVKQFRSARRTKPREIAMEESNRKRKPKIPSLADVLSNLSEEQKQQLLTLLEQE
jgi:hypothetical protein